MGVQNSLEVVRCSREFRNIDVFLLDYVLEGSVTGLDVLREIMVTNNNSKFVFLTAHSNRLRRELPADLNNIPVLDKALLRDVKPERYESEFLIEIKRLLLDAKASTAVQMQVSELRNSITEGNVTWYCLSWVQLQSIYKSFAVKLIPLFPFLLNIFVWTSSLPLIGEGIGGRIIVSIVGLLLLIAAYLTFKFYVPEEIEKYRDDLEYFKQCKDLLDSGLRNDLLNSSQVNKVPESDLYLLVADYAKKVVDSPRIRCALTWLFPMGIFVLFLPTIFGFVTSFWKWLT